MKVFNTLSRTKEEFIPIEPNKVKIYACGPTVYNFIHIGNARPLCVFDILRRYLEYRGNEVTFVQNFTDIDDKIINKAIEEGTDYKTISERYIEEFWTDVKGLGVNEATIHPKATESMDEIIQIVEEIVANGYGYAVGGDVYFRSRKFKEYGKLSKQPLDDLDAGNRIDTSRGKEDALDFVLWKAAKEGEPSWTSPWGQGRPGWHIECTAMIRKHLGESIDIHCGGQDLIFPHHENEIAQGECCGKGEHHDYARYWMHNGFINVDSRKMSKSLGNFFTVRDVATKYGYEPIKLMMIQAHYRTPINYTIEVIEQCQNSLERLHNCRDNLDFAIENATDGAIDADFVATCDKRKEQFITAMEDDFNTADGLTAIFELSRDINSYTTQTRTKESLAYAVALYDELTGVLGILYNRQTKNIDQDIEDLIAQRQQARKDKDFAKSDEIRDLLKAQGIVLEDTPQGVKWKRV